jgi:hypothetical protein
MLSVRHHRKRMRRLRREAERAAMPPPDELDALMKKMRAAELIAKRIVFGITDAQLVEHFHGQEFMDKLGKRKSTRERKIYETARAIEQERLLGNKDYVTSFQRYARAIGLELRVDLTPSWPPRSPSAAQVARRIRQRRRYVASWLAAEPIRRIRPRRRLAA